MGLISPGGENLLDLIELRLEGSTYDGDLRDPLWWPQVLALTPHKVLGPDIEGRGIPRGPRATRMGTGLY